MKATDIDRAVAAIVALDQLASEGGMLSVDDEDLLIALVQRHGWRLEIATGNTEAWHVAEGPRGVRGVRVFGPGWRLGTAALNPPKEENEDARS